MNEYIAADIQPIPGMNDGGLCDGFLYSRMRGHAYPDDEAEDPLWLMFPWEFELLMNGQKLEHIDGTIVHKGRDKIDTTMMLNSFMRYGLRESWFSE